MLYEIFQGCVYYEKKLALTLLHSYSKIYLSNSARTEKIFLIYFPFVCECNIIFSFFKWGIYPNLFLWEWKFQIRTLIYIYGALNKKKEKSFNFYPAWVEKRKQKENRTKKKTLLYVRDHMLHWIIYPWYGHAMIDGSKYIPIIIQWQDIPRQKKKYWVHIHKGT